MCLYIPLPSCQYICMYQHMFPERCQIYPQNSCSQISNVVFLYMNLSVTNWICNGARRNHMYLPRLCSLFWGHYLEMKCWYINCLEVITDASTPQRPLALGDPNKQFPGTISHCKLEQMPFIETVFLLVTGFVHGTRPICCICCKFTASPVGPLCRQPVSLQSAPEIYIGFSYLSDLSIKSPCPYVSFRVDLKI